MTVLLRRGAIADKEPLKRLWDDCFHDEKAFQDWFFDERYLPEFASVAEIDGKIASVVHGLPVNVRVRDTLMPGIIAAGVATDAAFRGQGLMRQVFSHFMAQSRKNGFAVVAHRPAALKTFFGIGHFPVSQSAYFTVEPNSPLPERSRCELIELFDQPAALYDCYLKFCAMYLYSGMISRSFADFALKLRDYLSCGARCLIYSEKGELAGYCVFFDDDEAYGEETCALSGRAYRELCLGLAQARPQKRAKLRVASNAPLPADFGKIETLEKSVMGAANISMALKATGLCGGAIEVTDGVVPENAGVFDLSGNKTDAPAQLKISAGRLTQWIVGYKSMRELENEGAAEVLRPSFADLCDSAGKRPCFIFDEY